MSVTTSRAIHEVGRRPIVSSGESVAKKTCDGVSASIGRFGWESSAPVSVCVYVCLCMCVCNNVPLGQSYMFSIYC